jgi:hypothetical protein
MKKNTTDQGLCLLRIERQKALEGKHPFGSLPLVLLNQIINLYTLLKLSEHSRERNRGTADLTASSQWLEWDYHTQAIASDLLNSIDYIDEERRKAKDPGWSTTFAEMRDAFRQEAFEEIAYQLEKLENAGFTLDIVELYHRFDYVSRYLDDLPISTSMPTAPYNSRLFIDPMTFPDWCKAVKNALCEELLDAIEAEDLTIRQKDLWIAFLADYYMQGSEMEIAIAKHRMLPLQPRHTVKEEDLFVLEGENYRFVDKSVDGLRDTAKN